jgi:hypothetical protein
VRGRILVGVGAWLAGAVAATGFSHLAVSLLGRGIASDSGRMLSSQAVRKALANVQANPSPPGLGPSLSAPTTPTAPGTGQQDRGILLASQGGTVIARCVGDRAYLKSWSPAQGFLVDNVARGPVAAAHVTFESMGRAITMRISCVGGIARVNLTYLHSGYDDSWQHGDT